MSRGMLAAPLAVFAVIACGCAAAPDLTARMSGWWEMEHDGLPPILRLLATPPDLRPEHVAPLREALSGLVYDGTRHIEYCRPRQFVGFLNGEGFEDLIELLFTPGRVTLTNEQGLLRRIAMGSPRSDVELPETPTGSSHGHWDGEVLVIETRALASTSRFPLPVAGAPLLGAGAHVTERIALVSADGLEIHSTLVAPELLTAPFEIVTRYVRLPDHLPLERNECPAVDRLIDPASGSTRFDLTPPDGLPPPPE